MGKELSTQGTLNSYELSNNKSNIYLWLHQVIDGVKTTKFATFENLVNAVYALLSDAFTPETPETALIGEIKMWSAATAPDKWLLCDGAAISRTTYADLFAVVSTTYGVGDGTTTFNLPDLRGRAPIGAGQGDGLSTRALGEVVGEEAHIITTGELTPHTHTGPSHTHTGPNHTHATTCSAWSGLGGGTTTRIVANVSTTTATVNTGSGGTGNTGSGGTGNTGSSGSGEAHNNIQPSLVVNFILYSGVSAL